MSTQTFTIHRDDKGRFTRIGVNSAYDRLRLMEKVVNGGGCVLTMFLFGILVGMFVMAMKLVSDEPPEALPTNFTQISSKLVDPTPIIDPTIPTPPPTPQQTFIILPSTPQRRITGWRDGEPITWDQ